MTFYKWSKTAASNANADATINWAEGQAPSSVNDSARAVMAAASKWRDDISGTITTGGTSTAYTVTTNQSFTTAALMSGAMICFIPHADSGAAPTLAVDGLTARAINYSTGVAIPTGALKTGTPYLVTYVHATTEFILQGALDKAPLTSVDIVGGTSLTAPDVLDSLAVYDVSDTANRKVLISDFYKTINGLTADATPSAANDYVVTYDASATAAKKVLLQNIPSALPRGYIDGCILSNGTDATNDINIAAGVCRDSTNTVNITVAAMSGKQLDANWAPGAAAGMRNSAVGIDNTTYHIWAAAKADGTQDIYAHTSATAATVLTALQAESGGADYLYLRHIMSILRDSGAIRAFKQVGDDVTWSSIVQNLSATPASTNQIARATTSPTGIKVRAKVTGYYHPISSNTAFVLLQPLDATDVAASATAFTAAAQLAQQTANFQETITTDTSGQIGSRVSAVAGSDILRINTVGFIHPRGRDA